MEEYEVGESIPSCPTFRPTLTEHEETVLRAKVFMRGKKMDWVGSILAVQLTPIETRNLEILCKGTIHVFLFEATCSPQAVQWKGYEDTENTYGYLNIGGTRQTPCSRNFCSWEPFKSFESCGEEIIQRFWERVDTKGRDVSSIEGWTNGEEVYPVGPPRMFSYLENYPKNLLSVEAERAGRHPKKIKLPILSHQRLSALYQEGLRMAQGQRDH